MKQVKWGIIGLGNIALKFAEGFQYTKNAKLFAISSRSENKLLTFKHKFKIDDNYIDRSIIVIFFGARPLEILGFLD